MFRVRIQVERFGKFEFWKTLSKFTAIYQLHRQEVGQKGNTENTNDS